MSKRIYISTCILTILLAPVDLYGQEIKAGKGDTIEAVIGEKRDQVSVKDKSIVLSYRFYSSERKSKRLRKKWRDEIKRWVKEVNNYCKDDIHIKKVESLKPDFKVAMYRENNGRKTKIKFFASNKTGLPERAKHEWIKGTDTLREFIFTRLSDDRESDEAKKIDALPYTFHIAIVKDVYGRVGGRDAMVPGIWMDDTNILVAQARASKLDVKHETGHLFGFADDTGGIMTKIHPNPPVTLKGYYGNERKNGWRAQSVRRYRCRAVKKHFGV